jgi:hypothetical protein
LIEGPVSGSFRDPSGFVFERDGVLYRQVNGSHRPHFDRFIESGLYEALLAKDLIVPHEDADLEIALSENVYRVIRPRRVAFISYPYEWCFSELKDAALATLEIQELSLDHGMSLRDASAYNIQFEAGRPVLIDTLSFEILPEGAPWVAYRQFCQHFLAPLALMRYRDVRLGELSQLHIDGVPLDLAAELLPFRARLRSSLLIHLFLHARSQRRHAQTTDIGQARRRGLSKQALRGLIHSVRSAVQKLDWEPGRSVWSQYYGEAESYSSEALEQKKELVTKLVEEAAPATVWDLGANTGLFSRIAADRAPTVAFDADPATVELNYRENGRAGNVLPLVMDLTNPSPAIGWANKERSSLMERGPADLAMALALIHHLAIANNVPLPRLADFFHDVGRWLLIEFVPKSDPMVARLLATRDDIFPTYTDDGFQQAFAGRFTLQRREPIPGSDRVLYLMRAR